MMAKTGSRVPVSVDGGVNSSNGQGLVEAGADILIAGSYVFQNNDMVERVQSLKNL